MLKIKGQTTIFDFISDTFAVNFYDTAMRQRTEWIKAESQEDAVERVVSRWGRNIQIESVVVSDLSFEEVMGID